MKQIPIDADALFRAVTATGHKVLAYHLDLDSGTILSRTLRPEEVADTPQGPSVPPLPKLGGELNVIKDAQPFGPPPVDGPKKKLFDDEGPRKDSFGGDFWKRENKKADPFGAGGFRRENATKKLAALFGEKAAPPASAPAPAAKGVNPSPFAGVEPPAPAFTPAPDAATFSPEDPRKPRIPIATEADWQEWMMVFAREAGDPAIRNELLATLPQPKPLAAFERVLRKYGRSNQQWDRWVRKQALLRAEAWLSELGIAWELIEPGEARLDS